jgi:DNA-binding transcriptional LysR family regulator
VAQPLAARRGADREPGGSCPGALFVPDPNARGAQQDLSEDDPDGHETRAQVANRNAPSQATALGLVAAGVGVSLVWDRMSNLRRPGVVYRPLADEMPRLVTALAWRQDDPSPIPAAFITLVRELPGAPGDSGRNPGLVEPGTIHAASPNTSAAMASRRNATAGPIE